MPVGWNCHFHGLVLEGHLNKFNMAEMATYHCGGAEDRPQGESAVLSLTRMRTHVDELEDRALLGAVRSAGLIGL